MAKHPYLDRLEARGTNTHGKISEKKVAKKIGARLHSNSGARPGSKSDASLTNSHFRLECKSTVNQTIPLELGWLAKIAKESTTHGQRPAVTLSFVDPDGKPRLNNYAEWICIPLVVFQELLNEQG